MALKAGRVGVAKDQVDEFGNIIGSTPENVYTKTQCDNKFETKTHANNTYQQKNIEVPLELLGGSQLTVEASLHAIEDTFGDLQFRDNEGTPQVKTPNGEWTNFNSGGGGDLGFNIPDNLLTTTGIVCYQNAEYVDGGYYIDELNGLAYIDVQIKIKQDSGTGVAIQYGSPVYVQDSSSGKTLCAVYVGGTGTPYRGCSSSVQSWSDSVGFNINGRANNVYRIFGIVEVKHSGS